ncbi:MAG TPA: hypothetical protein DIC22_01130 [Chitinophagaceae bacterium]|nr:hypothetical protein [Chitinophagaceae bacterium]
MRKKAQISSLQSVKTIAAAALISLLSITNGQAQETRGQAVVSSVTVTATVTKINQKTREVTIKTEDGREHSFIASEDVKNLPQVKKGDVITANYSEALAYQIREHGKASGVETTQSATAAEPGSKPAGTVAQQTTVTVTVTAIDPKVPSVTFRGPKGNTKTIKVKDPEKLKGVKIGDMVDITYTEAIAIRVDEAPRK